MTTSTVTLLLILEPLSEWVAGQTCSEMWEGLRALPVGGQWFGLWTAYTQGREVPPIQWSTGTLPGVGKTLHKMEQVPLTSFTNGEVSSSCWFQSMSFSLPAPTGPQKPLKHSLVVTAQSELAPVHLVWTAERDTITRRLPKCNLRVEIPHTRTKCSHQVY